MLTSIDSRQEARRGLLALAPELRARACICLAPELALLAQALYVNICS